MVIKKIYIGADHAGFKLKEKIKSWLEEKKIPFQDLGNLKFDHNDDYPDYADKVARYAVKDSTFGILICGSAEGVCIAANKVKGARAIIAFSKKTAQLAREHNDANIICLSGWKLGGFKAKGIVKTFLNTPFSGEARHLRRINKIKKMEK